MPSLWALALRNLRRNRRRSLTTGAAIALGFAGVTVLGGYFLRIDRFLGTNAAYLQHLGHVTLYKAGGVDRVDARPLEYSFTPNEQRTIASVLAGIPGVEFVARYVTGVGLAGNGCKTVPFIALGVEPEVERRLLEHPRVTHTTGELAQPIRGRAFPSYGAMPEAVALSAGLAHLLGKERIHDEVGATSARFTVPRCDGPAAARALGADANIQLAALTYHGNLSAIDGEIVDVFHTPLAATEDTTLVMSIERAQQLFDTDLVTYEAVFLEDPGSAHAVAVEIEAKLRAAGVAVAAYPFDDERTSAYYSGSIGMLGAIVRFMSVLLASVVAFTIVNAMMLSVMERARETGTLRAIGYRRRAVVGLYVREAVALTAMAVAVGTAVALAVSIGVNGANIRFHPPGVSGPIRLLITPTPALWTAVALATFAVAIAATVVAVRRHASRNIIEMLTDTTG